MTNPLEKIQALDAIEKEIILCIQSAGNALAELSKEKPSQKNAENHTNQFLKSLNSIENKLSDQINYLLQVSTTHAHEGSGYSSAKNLQMAWQRLNNVKARLKELEDSNAKKQGQTSTSTVTGSIAPAAPPVNLNLPQ
jgi:mediator of RNA polymerase II transcription subunit 11